MPVNKEYVHLDTYHSVLVVNLLIVAAGGQGMGGRQESFWTENVLLSLENINSEIREIWTILGKQQVPGNCKILCYSLPNSSNI